jgi:hypothetical protein
MNRSKKNPQKKLKKKSAKNPSSDNAQEAQLMEDEKLLTVHLNNAKLLDMYNAKRQDNIEGEKLKRLRKKQAGTAQETVVMSPGGRLKFENERE